MRLIRPRMVALLKTTAEPGMEIALRSNSIFGRRKETSFRQAPSSLRRFWTCLTFDMPFFAVLLPPSIHPAFQGNDYWVLINSNALPRAFVPKSVKTATNDGEELEALASPQFNPADVAYVESPGRTAGLVPRHRQITNEIPTRIMISAQMETPGLVVLADNWDKGWRAYWNGKPVPVLRANYAVRGVVVPAGNGTLEFIYRPASLILGLWLAGLAVIFLAGWLIAVKVRMVKIKVPPSPGQ